MSDDSADEGGDRSPDDEVPTADDGPSSGLPGWLPAVLRGGTTMVAAGIVLAVALIITNPDDSGSDEPDGSTVAGALREPAPTTTAAPPTTAVTPTTVAEAAATSAAPPTTVAPTPPTAPPPDAAEPVDERCPSYSVDEELPVEICDRGALIAEVQTVLTAAGFAVEVDGFFTSATEAAVIQFQAREGLEQDGLVGPQTAESLGIG